MNGRARTLLVRGREPVGGLYNNRKRSVPVGPHLRQLQAFSKGVYSGLRDSFGGPPSQGDVCRRPPHFRMLPVGIPGPFSGRTVISPPIVSPSTVPENSLTTCSFVSCPFREIVASATPVVKRTDPPSTVPRTGRSAGARPQFAPDPWRAATYQKANRPAGTASRPLLTPEEVPE
jgi:hypothetical protein